MLHTVVEIIIIIAICGDMLLTGYVFVEQHHSRLHRLAAARSVTLALTFIATLLYIQADTLEETYFWLNAQLLSLIVAALNFDFVWEWAERPRTPQARRLISGIYTIATTLTCVGMLSGAWAFDSVQVNGIWTPVYTGTRSLPLLIITVGCIIAISTAASVIAAIHYFRQPRLERRQNLSLVAAGILLPSPFNVFTDIVLRGVGLVLPLLHPVWLLVGNVYVMLGIARQRAFAPALPAVTQPVISSMSQGLLVTDNAGRIQAVNPALTQITGQHETDLVRTPVSRLLASDPRELNEQSGIETVVQTSHGPHPVLVSAAPIIHTHGRHDGFVYLVTDIAARKQTETERDILLSRLRHLSMLTHTINEKLSLERALPTIVQLAAELIDVDGAVIQILDERAADGYVVYQYGLATTHYPLATSQEILRTFETVTVPNPPHGSRIVAPICTHNKLLGLLEVVASDRTVSRDDAELIDIVATQAGVTIYNAMLFRTIEHLAISDALTDVYNRRHVLTLGQREIDQSLRFDRPLAAMMLDIDHFKRINDTYGHSIGDLALRTVAKHCTELLRSHDIIGRYGGEEFIFLLPNTNLPAAEIVAERIRATIVSQPIIIQDLPLQITVSIGVATTDPTITSLEALIDRADQAAYVAKRTGRNRVAIWGAEEMMPV